MTRCTRFVEAALADLDEVRLFPSEEERRRTIRAHLGAAARPWDLAIGIAVLLAAADDAWWALRLGLPVVLGALPAGAPAAVQRDRA